MLPLSRGHSRRHKRPPVLPHHEVRGLSEKDDRLDSESVARLHSLLILVVEVVVDEGVLMESATDAVTPEVRGHIEGVLGGEGLDDFPDALKLSSWLALIYSREQGLASEAVQLGDLGMVMVHSLILRVGGDNDHGGGVAVVALLDVGGDVDVNAVALLEGPVVGYSMAEYVVHGGADRLRKAHVADRSGVGFLGEDSVMDDFIDIFGSSDLVAFYCLYCSFQHMGDNPRSFSHTVDGLRRVSASWLVAFWRTIFIILLSNVGRAADGLRDWKGGRHR